MQPGVTDMPSKPGGLAGLTVATASPSAFG
jgi:hypothetical protein